METGSAWSQFETLIQLELVGELAADQEDGTS